MPTYMGTLTMTPPETVPKAILLAEPGPDGTTVPLPPTILGPLKGRKLNTDMHIVLHNAVHSFTKANVLDLKLGSRLWDDDAPVEKRARLDAVAQATTSGSLGFRIAGMRTWQGDAGELSEGAQEATKKSFGDLHKETGMFSYNKLYGRQFKNMDVVKGFREFVLVPNAGIDVEHALGLTEAFLEGSRQLEVLLKETELRMYSASVLFSYEGSGKMFDAKHKAAKEAELNSPETDLEEEAENDEEEEEEEEEEEGDPNLLLTIKIIDFAHAWFKPGEGPDLNILQGVRSIIEILETIREELSQNEKA
jgi:1D-myo-inositol-tetrakisphosphate 5-kinase/inositol-polyphosphate multikinase